MIGSFAVGSMMVGSTFGGSLIARGRLKILNLAAYIGIIGVSLTLILLPGQLDLSLILILTGRLVYGFATGLIAVAMPRYMDEVLPSKLIGLYGGLYCFSFAIATIMAYFLALGLPEDKDANGNENTQALLDDQFWRVIFGLPILFFLIQIFMMNTICKYESPKFLIL